MTHPLREAVARAMFEADEARLAPVFRHQWDNILSQRQEEYRDRAGTAIAATLAGIREPSEGMMRVGMTEATEHMVTYDEASSRLAVGNAWRAMIDVLAQEVAGDG